MNINSEDLFKVLDNADRFESCQALVKRYLNAQIERYDHGQDDPMQIAYEIAGLMGARSVIALSKEHKFMRIFDVAGQLELPEQDREIGATWERLRSLLDQLDQ